jgi:tRNA uridine 5-carboxymethylaminomethyl modification enzyme
MFNGRIQGLGPRYCPSIEDKINRFADRDRHQIFVEPEGWNTVEIYVNGFSTSLPEDVQYKALTRIPGFENAKMFRPGYAIEYDFFQPTQLQNTLETNRINHLYFAGQINGTTGYEEAGCQGLVAGINAHLKINDLPPFVLSRAQAYIGVLIDDLINKGTDEPYRMFTSRAEHRLLLRQDNADLRLTKLSYGLGLANDDRYNIMKEKEKQTASVISLLNNIRFKPDEINPILQHHGHASIKDKSSLAQLLKRPGITLDNLALIYHDMKKTFERFSFESMQQAEIQIKYETYIDREKKNSEKIQALENHNINPEFDYHQIPSLSKEAREKLFKIKPATLGQRRYLMIVKFWIDVMIF